MAFYPDELSPIDRVRSLGKQTDALPDVGPLKNRRQWKSLVLGKKDLGMNSFATIAEEKEEEISRDGSQSSVSTKSNGGAFPANPGAVTNKKITFPKPRKYITSRVSDRKEDGSSRGAGSPAAFASLGAAVGGLLDSGTDAKGEELCSVSAGSKANAPGTKHSAGSGKSTEFVVPSQTFVQNYALNETPIDCQWKDAFSEGVGPEGWSRAVSEKSKPPKCDAAPPSKSKQEEKRKSSGSSKSSAAADKRNQKAGKRKGNREARKKSPRAKEELPSTSALDGPPAGIKGKKPEKGKALNMKDVVHVYKNLAYGSKEEIKSFVENLSFVEGESKAESDKNLLSMMNLKALENKIKNFAKKSGKSQAPSTSQEKKPKGEKTVKRNRKAHVERLARHKAVKVPAVLGDATQAPVEKKPSERKEKKASVKDKEPWKYVGMESALDKTYFVYPAYPPSVNLKSASKAKKGSAKGTGKAARQKKGTAAAAKASDPETKVKKDPRVVLKTKSFAGGGARSRGPNVSASASHGSANHRSSAVTVCTVKFRPAVGRKTEEPPVGAADQSLLVYLHGAKAIHVKSPYSDKQFSRVKFFRKDEGGVPLIKGIGRRSPPQSRHAVSVRNAGSPGKPARVRSFDSLDFDEDIQNITDFLRSQDGPDRRRPEERRGTKTREGERRPRESPRERGSAASRRRRRRRRPAQDLLPTHDHPRPRRRRRCPCRGRSPDAPSPDSIITDISRNIRHLQYLPDTEGNRKMIGDFFDELDQRIEASRDGALAAFRRLPSLPCPEPFGPIPILGY